MADPSTKDACGCYELIAKLLLDMVTEGIVEEAVLFSFNVPIYLPYKDEVKAIIQKEGSFNLDKLHIFKVNWDASDNDDGLSSAKTMADDTRDFMEPMLASHFGESIMDDFLFRLQDRAFTCGGFRLLQYRRFFNKEITS